MRRRVPARLVAVALLAAAALAAGGTATAYFTGSGGGVAQESTGAPLAVALSPTVPAATLVPGGEANVVLTISNPNAASVHIGSLALDPTQGTGGFALESGHAGCDLSTLRFTTKTNGGAGWNVPGRVDGVDGTLPVTLPNALAMGTGAANACQGASTTVYLVAGP